MTITVDDVRADTNSSATLIELDDIREILSATEPFNSTMIPVGPLVRFRLGAGWAHDIDGTADEEPVDATMQFSNKEYQLTKEGLFTAAKIAHIPSAYLKVTPADLMELHMNYWWQRGLGEGETFQMLSVKDEAIGFTKDSIQPFSNLRLLENVLAGIEDKYGKGEVLVDGKFHHSLKRTDLRLIVPEKTRQIRNTGVDNDLWSTGIHIYNSLLGIGQTEIGGYLYRYFCTNGAQDTFASAGTWNRRTNGQSDDIFEWAKTSVDEILGGLEHSLDKVQELTELDVSDGLVELIEDLATQYGIPAKDTDAIMRNMVAEKTASMYSVMQAVTASATRADLSPKQIDRLMRAGGDIIHTAHDRCDACHRPIH